MPSDTPTIDSSLADMPKRKWLRAVEAVAEEDGYFQSLGKRHFSAFIERETTLLVSCWAPWQSTYSMWVLLCGRAEAHRRP